MFNLALFIGKFLTKSLTLIGRGSNLPGEIALKIEPELLKKIHCNGKIIAVTGSNGKTSTANTISYILKDNGFNIINNAKGSNLTGGVATCLLNNANAKGEVNCDYVVLEVDERYSPLIFKYFQPDYLVVTNLFRDQLTRNGNVDIIIEKLEQAIKKDVVLILNGNDPISSNILKDNKRIYYGLDKTKYSTKESFNITHDAKVCPKCYGKMNYEYYHYNHIGKFKCSNCDYKTPELKYLATDLDLENGNFKINNTDTSTTYKATFNVLNMVAACAICCELGLNINKVCSSLSNFKIMKQRYEEFDINGRKAIMVLSKNQNPVSYDQSISHVLNIDGEKTVIAVIRNINHTYEKDTTWLYDIAFERLVGNVDKMICCGERAYDLAVRLKIAGFNDEDILISTDINDVKPLVNKTKGTLCILTELYDANSILKVVKNERN